MQEAIEIRFTGGINQDVNPIDMKASGYFDARNITLFNYDGSEFGSVVNADGNRLLKIIPDIPANGGVPAQTNLKIIGLKVIQNYIIAFTTNNEEESPVDSYGQIWLFEYSHMTKEFVPNGLNALKYNGKLGFSLFHKISSIEVNYKSDDTLYVYWADGYNQLRTCNILDPNISSYTTDAFDLLPKFTNLAPSINKVNNSGGEFTSGSVQYAYRLKYKSISTSFSGASEIAPIFEGAIPNWGTWETFGSAPAEITNKSVEISIDLGNNSQVFDEIEVYRIFYQYYNDQPLVTKILDSKIPSQHFTYTDNGIIDLGRVDLLELSLQPSTTFTPQWIASNKNRLFAASIKEYYVDVQYDARAYRFKKNTTDAEYKINSGDSSYTNVYSTYSGDFISIDEKADLEIKDANLQQYRKNSGTLGGDGPNVSYQIITTEKEIDSYGDAYKIAVEDESVDDNTYYSMVNMNYLRDETYRFGVVFYDEKGSASFAYWIADIKMPTAVDVPISRYNAAEYHGTMYGKHIGVAFYLKNIPINPKTNKPYAYQIVRVDRKEDDHTIIDSGFVLQADKDSHDKYAPNLYGVPSRYNNPSKNSYYLYSPNVSFFDLSDKISYTGTKLRMIQRYSMTNAYYLHSNNYWDNDFSTTNHWITVDSTKYYDILPAQNFADKTISDSQFLREFTTATIGGLTYQNGAMAADYTLELAGARCTGLYLDSKITYPEQTDSLILVNIVDENVLQYGGSSYAARLRNTYIKASAIVYPTVQSSNVESFEGDTFIYPFTVAIGTTPLRNNNRPEKSRLNIKIVPIESTVNWGLQSEVSPATHRYKYGPMERAAWQDKAGVYMFDDNISYNQPFDAFVYNSAYSKKSTSKVFVPKPDDIDASHGKLLIRYSDLSGETDLSDGWRVFRTNNYQTVDGNFGEIRSIHRLWDSILFFQEGAFGKCAVDERVLQQNVNQVSVVLGEGRVLAKPQYISNNNGCIHGNSVVTTNNTVMFYDNIARGIMMYQQSSQGSSNVELSLVSGLAKTMKNRFNARMNNANKLLNYSIPDSFPTPGYSKNIRLHTGVNAISNKDEIYFSFFDVDTVEYAPYSFKDIPEYDTVKFTNTLKAFTSFHDFSSPIYETLYNNILAVEPTDLRSIWIFDEKASKSSYYDTLHDSSITLLLSGNNRLDKLFANITYVTDVTKDGVDYRDETFNTLRVWNEHQDTGVFDLDYMKNMKRRMRKWHVTIPRAQQLRAGDRKDSRIRSKYIYSKFTFVNNDDKKIVLNNLVFNYILSREEISTLQQK